MPATLFGERFLGAREPAWHGLGEVFNPDTDPLSAIEAVSRAKCDYTVDVLPALVRLPSGLVIEAPKQFAIVREPTADSPEHKIFGYASKDFAVLQNSDIARIVNPLTIPNPEIDHPGWPVETVGALGDGEKFFLTLDAGGATIAGEDYRDYFVVADTKLPGEALEAFHTTVRIVCGNTWILGHEKAQWLDRIQHRQGAEADLELSISILRQLRIQLHDNHQKIESLAIGRLVQEQVEDILAKAYPVPRPSRRATLLEQLAGTVELDTRQQDGLQKAADRHDSKVNAVLAYRDGARQLFEKFNDEQPALANTRYALCQAVVECEDFRKNALGDANVANSATFGYRAGVKARAFQAALAITPSLN